MRNDEKTIYLNPELKNKSPNPIAAILKTLVTVLWIGGAILGIALGFVIGSKSHFSFITMIITWAVAFSLGLFPYAFAEIISLLHQANNTSYKIDMSVLNSLTNTVSVGDRTNDSNDKWEYDLDYKDNTIPFNIKKLNAESVGQEGYLTLLIKPTVAFIVIDAIMVDICVENKLGEPYTLSDIVFTEFERAGELLSSSGITCQLTKNMLSNIKSVEIIVKEYSVNKKVYKIGQDEYFFNEKTEGESIDELMATIYQMNSTIEVYKYFEELAAKGSIWATPGLVQTLKKDAEIERLYGNRYQECIKKLESHFRIRHEEDPKEQPKETFQSEPKPIDEELSELPEPESDEYEAQVEEDKNDSGEIVFCIRCGHKIESADSIFCPKCGERIIR